MSSSRGGIDVEDQGAEAEIGVVQADRDEIEGAVRGLDPRLTARRGRQGLGAVEVDDLGGLIGDALDQGPIVAQACLVIEDVLGPEIASRVAELELQGCVGIRGEEEGSSGCRPIDQFIHPSFPM